jgi:hypothetical protein
MELALEVTFCCGPQNKEAATVPARFILFRPFVNFYSTTERPVTHNILWMPITKPITASTYSVTELFRYNSALAFWVAFAPAHQA